MNAFPCASLPLNQVAPPWWQQHSLLDPNRSQLNRLHDCWSIHGKPTSPTVQSYCWNVLETVRHKMCIGIKFIWLRNRTPLNSFVKLKTNCEQYYSAFYRSGDCRRRMRLGHLLHNIVHSLFSQFYSYYEKSIRHSPWLRSSQVSVDYFAFFTVCHGLKGRLRSKWIQWESQPNRPQRA